MAAEQPALRLRGIDKSFDGVHAVKAVSLDITAGEVHGLVGENGAGKSTLIKVASGVLLSDAGTVEICGARTIGSVHAAQDAGLATLHQEIPLVPQLDAAENILLGAPYPTHAGVAIDWPRVRAQARAALERLGATVPVDQPVGTLSPAMQTMVTLARALSREARVLILDEPTASLTDQEIGHLFEVIHRLRDDGVAVLYVSHRLEEIFALCDRVSVMRDGDLVATEEASALTVDRLIELMVGRAAGQLFPDRDTTPGEVVLAAEGLTGHRVRDVDLQVRAGEVLGVAGLGGSGRSELLRLLSGAQRPQDGRLLLRGQPRRLRSPKAALRAGVALVPEERRTQGLVLTQSVGENLVSAVLGRLALFGTLRRPQRERARAQALVTELRIRVASLRQNVAELSGGNQQKVVLGKFLARDPMVLLLDEPTRGIDVGTKAEIYRLVRELTTQGRAVVLVSSELAEVIGLADRIVVLHEGRLVTELPAAEASEEQVLAHCYGRSA
jgi:ABC-type sugar transport system ATPase subunit